MNPYTLTFGKKPNQYIISPEDSNEIIDSFSSENPSQQIFLISGVRGSGKTVLMTDVAQSFERMEDWVVVDLNSEDDMLKSLGAKLYSNSKLSSYFNNLKINLSVLGIGAELDVSNPVVDMHTIVESLILELSKQGKKVLICIDEVYNNKHMRAFAGAFQILVRKDYPVFLLMTGLYENVRSIQDEKNLTFLYRAPRISTSPLNIGAIARNYQEVLGIAKDEALRMARLTKGYAFAFQVLGYLIYKNGGYDDTVISDLRIYLEDYVYGKILSELSEKDREVIKAIAKSEDGKVETIRNILGYTTNQLNPYRKRLIDKGIVNSTAYGYLDFTLPLFREFVEENG